MSAIASVYMIDKSKVEELKKMAGVAPETRKSLFGKVKETGPWRQPTRIHRC